MPLVISGRVHHRQMQPDQVGAALVKQIPGLVVSAPDFSVDQYGCEVKFFCTISSTPGLLT
jgi:hypothetical protein